MDAAEHIPKVDIVLDVFGQRLVVIFTQISFCFQMKSNERLEDIRAFLEKGLVRLSEAFPWLTGQVVCEGATSTSTGTFKIVSLEPRPRMVLKDLRSEKGRPSRIELAQQGYPMRELREEDIAPRNTSSGRPGDVTAEVFQLQVNIVEGGTIITFLGQHQAMDGTGLARAIYLFAKACRGDTFTEEEKRIGNLSSDNTIPLYKGDWTPGSEISHNIVLVNSEQSGPGHPRSKIPSEPGLWAHIDFTAAGLRQLKDIASGQLPQGVEYTSTDDALTAFLWKSITRARSVRMQEKTVLLARAVDLRRYLDISVTHPGFVQSMTYHSATVSTLIRESLGSVAADLRVAVDKSTTDLPHHGRSFATLISQTEDKSKTSYLAGFDMARDVMISSWANQNSYELDFGPFLGRPEAVRRPYFKSFPGLAYILPKTLTGDIGVAICLSEDDMNRLKVDSQFQEFARYVG